MSAKQNQVRKIYAQIHMSKFKNIKDEEEKKSPKLPERKGKTAKGMTI